MLGPRFQDLRFHEILILNLIAKQTLLYKTNLKF